MYTIISPVVSLWETTIHSIGGGRYASKKFECLKNAHVEHSRERITVHCRSGIKICYQIGIAGGRINDRL